MSFLNKRIQFMRPRANGRSPSNYPNDGCGVPLRITRLFPMKLKDVDVKALEYSKRPSDVVCIAEMMSLFDCFEKHDFARGPCVEQAKLLERCYEINMAKRIESKEMRKQLKKHR